MYVPFAVVFFFILVQWTCDSLAMNTNKRDCAYSFEAKQKQLIVLSVRRLASNTDSRGENEKFIGGAAQKWNKLLPSRMWIENF